MKWTDEDMKSAYGCGWGDAIVFLDIDDKDIMLKQFKDFMERQMNIKNYLATQIIKLSNP